MDKIINVNKYYYELVNNPSHTLVAGSTGSGKSVVLNGIITTLQQTKLNDSLIVLLDPKAVELHRYKNNVNCLMYAAQPDEIETALLKLVNLMYKRFERMKKANTTKSTEKSIYVFIDEIIDIKYRCSKQAIQDLNTLAFLARATNIYLFVCTQRPTMDILPPVLRSNLNNVIGLHTINKRQSINVLQFPGCENLPLFGYGYYYTPKAAQPELIKIPYQTESELNEIARKANKKTIITKLKSLLTAN